MQKKNKQIKAARPFVLLLVCVLILSSFSVAYATSLGKHNSAFTLVHNKMDSNPDQTYPYNSSDAKITQVGFDVLYGTKRDLVEYFGEVPYDNTWDGDKRVDGWNGFYAIKGTPNIADKDYWGDTGISSGSSKVSVEQLEKVNTENEVKSLRLHALHISPVAFWHWLGNAWYIVMSTFAWLGTKLISLMVAAKNIDMKGILDAFKLGDVSDAVNRVLIWNPDAGEHGQISILAAFCILMFFVSIAGCVFNYVRGRKKEKDLVTSILIPAFIGVLLTMMALTGKINNIGTILSDGANKVIYEIAAMTADSSGGAVFISEIEDSANSGKIVQIQEMGLINKCYIDMQICTQFKVSSIKALEVTTDNFGSAASTNLSKLEHVSGSTDMKNEFGNNIGYYFWFADSSAAEKTSSNKTYPKTKAMCAEGKIESIITWMQATYNSSSTSDTQKARLVTMLEGLASPDSGAGGARMFLFTVVMILLALCLWRYVRDILLAKIQLFVGLLGLAVAGPLLFTGKKKLINTAKDILGITLLSFIEITIHSVMFDVIIYAVSVMIGPEFSNLFVTIALLLLLFKFNKKLNEKIHELTQRIEGQLMSSGSPVKTFRNKLTKAVRETPHKWALNAANAYDKTSTVDENGIERSNEGNWKSRMLRNLANTTARADETESMIKINHDYNKARKESKADYEQKRAEFAEAKVNDIESGMERDAQERITELKNAREAEIRKAFKDTDNYTQEEKELLERKKALDTERANQEKVIEDARRFSNEGELKTIKDKLARGESISTEEQEKIDQSNAVIAEMQKDIDTMRKESIAADLKLNASITSRVDTTFTDKHLSESEKLALDKTKGNLEAAVKLNTQQSKKYKDKYQEALDEQAKLAKEQMDELLDPDKIGGHKKANEAAIRAYNVSSLKKAELERGLVVDDTFTAARLTEDATQRTKNEIEFNIAQNEKNKEYKQAAEAVESLPKELRDKAIAGTKDNNKFVQVATKAGTREIVNHTKVATKVASGTVKATGAVVGAASEVGKMVDNRLLGDDVSVQNQKHIDSVIEGVLAQKAAGVATGQIDAKVTTSTHYQRAEAKKAEKKEQRETKREEKRERAEEKRSERDEARQEARREKQEEKDRRREERRADRDEWSSSRKPGKDDYSSMASAFERDAKAKASSATPTPSEPTYHDLLGQDVSDPTSSTE